MSDESDDSTHLRGLVQKLEAQLAAQTAVLVDVRTDLSALVDLKCQNPDYCEYILSIVLPKLKAP